MKNSFETKFPKLLTKGRAHVVGATEDSLFGNIVTWCACDVPAHRFLTFLQQDTLMNQKSVEADIAEENALTDSSRAFLTTCLEHSVSFVESSIDFIKVTYLELTLTRCS